MNDRNLTPQMMNLLNKNQIHQMMIKNQQQPQRPQPPMSNLQNVPLPMHNYMNQNQPMNVNVPIMNQNSHMLNQQNINQNTDTFDTTQSTSNTLRHSTKYTM